MDFKSPLSTGGYLCAIASKSLLTFECCAVQGSGNFSSRTVTPKHPDRGDPTYRASPQTGDESHVSPIPRYAKPGRCIHCAIRLQTVRLRWMLSRRQDSLNAPLPKRKMQRIQGAVLRPDTVYFPSDSSLAQRAYPPRPSYRDGCHIRYNHLATQSACRSRQPRKQLSGLS